MLTLLELEASKTLLVEIRESFVRGDWETTAAIYESITQIKTDKATRLEALCLATRALVGAKYKPAARRLLKTVDTGNYKKSAHYEFLARAHLDLKQYLPAAEACKRAEELRVAEANRPAGTKPK